MSETMAGPELTERSYLRSQLQQAVRRTAAHLGVEPRLTLDGPLDTLVPDEIATDLHAVLRAALANVATHSHVSELSVEVAADLGAGELHLAVRDDGQNVRRGPASDTGLADIAAAARRWHGGYSVHVQTEGGTEVRWTVPLSPGVPGRPMPAGTGQPAVRVSEARHV